MRINMSTLTFKTEPVIPLPKKHSYSSSPIQTKVERLAHIIEQVKQRVELVKEPILEISTKGVYTPGEVTDKKSQKLDLSASDNPNMKRARETRKKKFQQLSAAQPSTSHAPTSLQPSASQASTSQPSTSKGSKSKASGSEASTSEASTSKASPSTASTSKASKSKASTSKASKSKKSTPKATRKASSTATGPKVCKKTGEEILGYESEPSTLTSVGTRSTKIDDSQFWLETVKSKFKSSAYKDLLRESGFTEPQAGVIQNFFHQAARKMYNTYINSDRVKKTLKCKDCAFTVSHQCVSFHFLHAGWLDDDPTEITYMDPQRTNICRCQFAFFHVHVAEPDSETKDTARSERTMPIEVDRIATLRCDYCDTIIMIEHPFHKNTECTLTKWTGITSKNEKTFHAQVADSIKGLSKQQLSLEELYACRNRCCLFFHRCFE